MRGPERRVTRYKISCTSTSVVMKSLQLRVLRNETMNCTKELCIGKLLYVHFVSDVFHRSRHWSFVSYFEGYTIQSRLRRYVC